MAKSERPDDSDRNDRRRGYGGGGHGYGYDFRNDRERPVDDREHELFDRDGRWRDDRDETDR